ncbi:MAG: fibronectin type III domain-containing protein [Bacteroidia bacterium]
MKQFISTLFLAVIFCTTAIASHISGGELSYTRINSTSIRVQLKLYRDCGGIGLCGCPPGPLNTGCTISVSLSGRSGTCNNTSFGTFNLNVLANSGVTDVIQLCNLAGNTLCSNCGTKTPGSFMPAFEIYTFEGIVSLASVPANCNSLALAYTECCRSVSITTLSSPSSQNFYTELVFDKRFDNSSPVFTNRPLSVIYNGQEINYNIGGYDADGDSLSYSIVTALRGANTNATYLSPYTAAAPLPFFGFPNPNATAPMGISINPANGDLRFMPMGITTAPLPILVREWRKDSVNIWTNISNTRREMLINTLNSPSSNFLPSIRTFDLNTLPTATQPTLNYTITAGQQLCFVAVASDSTDTTNLSWNSPADLINLGASLIPMYNPSTRALNGPRKDSMMFCWIPPVNAARVQPYYFVLTARDRFCPLPANFTKAIRIKVDSSNGIFTPLIPPAQMSVSNNTGNSITLNWTAGSGTNSLVIARANNANFTPPSNGVFYAANSVFGMGTQLMKTAGSYVVYNGSGNSVNVTGLTPGTTYFFRVYTFNGTGSSTNYNRGFYTATSTQTLPVELKEIEVFLNEKGEAELKWTTATEINNSHFEIERSFDSESSFNPIAEVKGQGNSNLLKSYLFVDALNQMDISASRIYYRLKQVDYDGKFAYSPIVSLDLNAQQEQSVKVNPNPFKDEIKLSGVRELSSLKLYEPSGKEILNKVLSGSLDGTYVLKISSQEKGIFILKINEESFKLIKE